MRKNFNPLKNYYGEIKTEIESLNYLFWELIKNLVAISSNAGIQREYLGVYAPEEMAGDFDTYYTINKTLYLEKQILDLSEAEKLDKVDQFLNQMSGQENELLWIDDCLEKRPEWERLREMAIEILAFMGYSNLSLTFDHKVEIDVSECGKAMKIFHTKTFLKKK